MRPSQVCYNIAIKACGSRPGVQPSHKQLDLGYGLLEEMRREGLAPDPFTYTSLFTISAQAKDGERPVLLYQVTHFTLSRRGVASGQGYTQSRTNSRHDETTSLSFLAAIVFS
jgi:hypothetical protein